MHTTKLVAELGFFNLYTNLGKEKKKATKHLSSNHVKWPQVSFSQEQDEKYFVV